MTTIGSEIRSVPAIGDAAPAMPGEGAGLADMFGEIIAGVSVAVGAQAVAQDGASAVVAEEAPAEAAADPSAAASVVQLLALTVKQQAKALAGASEPDEQTDTEATSDEDGQSAGTGECVTDVPILGAGVTPIAPPPTGRPALKAQEQAAVATASPHLAAAQDAKVLKAAKEAKVATVPDPKVAAQEEPDSSPIARAVSELLDATRQLSVPQSRKGDGQQVVRPTDAKPDNLGQEVRSIVHNAISGLHNQTAAAPFDIARPAEALLEPLVVEAKTDFAEVAIERQLDVSADGEWLDSLARDIARSAGEGGTLRFKLNPENLGSLRVEITPQANGSAVRLTAETDTARAIIAEAQPRLVAEAKANGLRISETHVDLGGQAPSGDPRRQNAAFEEAPLRTARFLRDQEESDGKPTPSRSERYA